MEYFCDVYDNMEINELIMNDQLLINENRESDKTLV